RTDGTSETFLVPVHANVKRHGVRAEVDPQTVFVTLQPEAQQTVPIRINQVDSLPVGFELAAPPAADPAQAQVVGLKQNVDAVDAVYADLHLTGLSVSTTITVPLIARSSDGRTVSGPTVQPAAATIHVAIKRAVFSQDAYVGVQTHGKPAPGYQVVGVTSDPPSVTVQGTLDVLNSVTTIATDPVEVEGATQDVKRVVALRPPTGLTVVDATTVTATVSIGPARGPGSVLVAPRFVNAAPGMQVQTPNTSIVVSFTGPQPQILALKPGDISATVDLSGLAPGSYSLEPKIGLPAGLDKDSVTPPKVDVTLTALSPPPSATPAR
ncbi:MAG: CdaR family protein, partial [Mycobacterium sp.]